MVALVLLLAGLSIIAWNIRRRPAREAVASLAVQPARLEPWRSLAKLEARVAVARWSKSETVVRTLRANPSKNCMLSARRHVPRVVLS